MPYSVFAKTYVYTLYNWHKCRIPCFSFFFEEKKYLDAKKFSSFLLPFFSCSCFFFFSFGDPPPGQSFLVPARPKRGGGGGRNFGLLLLLSPIQLLEVKLWGSFFFLSPSSPHRQYCNHALNISPFLEKKIYKWKGFQDQKVKFGDVNALCHQLY